MTKCLSGMTPSSAATWGFTNVSKNPNFTFDEHYEIGSPNSLNDRTFCSDCIMNRRGRHLEVAYNLWTTETGGDYIWTKA